MAPGREPDPRVRGSADSGRQRVWVLQDGKAVDRMVRTGLSDGQKTEILDGLNEGDAVIIGLGTASRSGSGPTGGGPRLRL
jgi:HlyD family secretion protein